MSIKNKSKKNCSWLKSIKLISSILVPLMIGVFTVVTTVQQVYIAKKQREQDLALADNLHKQTIYNSYIDDIATLLLKTNEVIEEKNLYIRIKTLTILRELDVERKKNLLLFLYDRKVITSSNNFDLSSANFNDISFESTLKHKYIFNQLSLHSVYLQNTSFINCKFVKKVNFSYSSMLHTNFSQSIIGSDPSSISTFHQCNLDYASFSGVHFFQTAFTSSSLAYTDFTNAKLSDVVFKNANLTGAILTDKQLEETAVSGIIKNEIYNSIMPNGSFSQINDRKLIINGDAERNCLENFSMDPLLEWTLYRVISYKYNLTNITKDFGNCYFGVKENYLLSTDPFMFQDINIEDYSLLIDEEKAVFNLSVYFSSCSGSSFRLELIVDNYLTVPLNNEILENVVVGSENYMKYYSKSGIIPRYTRRISVIISFSNVTSSCMCDNIRFIISEKK